MLSANNAVWNLGSSPHDTLTIISPADESFVSGVVDIVAVVEDPRSIAQVEFIIWSLDTSETIIYETVVKSDYSGQYIYQWDTTKVEDGYYGIYASAYDEDGNGTDSYSVYCTVANNRQDGLVIEVKKPGDKKEAAAGALVTVHHAYYDHREDCIIYEELWYGHADMNGMVIIPGTVATGGNDFFITAKGTEPSFVYYATARAPSRIVIDSSNTYNTVIEAKDIDGSPLEGARVLVELLESNIPGSTTPDKVIDFGYYNSDYNISQVAVLDSNGKANIYLTEGKYNIRVIRHPNEGPSAGSPTGYYLFNYGVDISGDSEVITFIPQPDNISILSFLPDRLASYAELSVECEEPYFDGFMVLHSGDTIMVTPGDYRIYGSLTYADPLSDNTQWEINFDAGNVDTVELKKGTQTTIQADCSSASLEVSLSFPDIEYHPDDYIYFETVLRDFYGNRITSITKTPGTGTRDYGWITIKGENGGVLSYTNISSCLYDLWHVPQKIHGNFTAEVKIKTPVFGEVVNTVDFVVLPGSGDHDIYYDLHVTVLDSEGKPMSGVKLEPVAYETSSVSSPVLYPYKTDENGKAFLLLDRIDGRIEGINHGILILAEAGSENSEPLFMFVPVDVDADNLPMDITINLSEYPMKKVIFESYDINGNLFSEQHHNAIYVDTGNGILAGLTFDKQDSGERVLWLPYGRYEYQTFINAAVGMDLKPLYFMTESFEINEDSPETQTITLGGPELVPFEVFPSGWPDCMMLAVTLYSSESSLSPVFYRNLSQGYDVAQGILVTPGTYNVQGAVEYSRHTESWTLWIENKNMALTADQITDETITWEFGEPFDMQFGINNPSPGVLDTVTFSGAITDHFGNRIIGAAANKAIGIGISSLSEEDDITIQEHYKIAPFIYIKNPLGEEVFRYKNDQSNYELLMKWVSWNPKYEGSLEKISSETTFSGAEYTIPEDFPGGEYTAVFELDLGFLGTLRKELTFYIDAGLAAPVLNQQEPLITNAERVIVTGTTWPDATVKLLYTLDGGEKTEACTIQAGSNGMFNTEIMLPSEGTYMITAVVVENGTTSKESNPYIVTVDRTPPAQPQNLRGESPDKSHVNLSWEAPPGENPLHLRYEIYRNGTLIAQDITGGESLYYQDSGLSENTEYSYRIIAIDIAGNPSNASEITVRTSEGQDTVPPEKPSSLRAEYDGLAGVNLSWNASTDNVGVTGYKIYRSLNGSDWIYIGSVDMATLTYKDSNLYAETTYLYSVTAYDGAGNESEKSEPAEVATPPLSLDTARLSVKKDRNGLIDVGSQISITVQGDRNRKAYVEFYLDFCETMPGEKPSEVLSEKTDTVQLTEIKDPFGNGTGVYQGTYTISENTAVVKAAKAFISDEAQPEPHLASSDITGLPLEVTGTLLITITETTPEAFDIIRNGYLHIWSNTEKYGDYEKITNYGPYILSGLIPSEDYSLKLTGIKSRDTVVQENIKVLGGITKSITIEPPEPSTLYVRVEDEDQNPVENVVITVINQKNNGVISTGRSNRDGWASDSESARGKDPVFKDKYGIQKITIWVSLDGNLQSLYYPTGKVDAELYPGTNETVITLNKRPMGTLEGVITSHGGHPLEEAVLKIIQIVDGAKFTRSVKTDANGYYSINLNEGPAKVSISHWRATKNSSWDYDAVVEADKTTNLSVDINPTAAIKLEAYMKRAGEPEYPLAFSSWSVNSDILVSIKTKSVSGSYISYARADGRNDAYLIKGANPGDQFEVLLDGRQAGFRKETVTVELDENYFGKAEIHLIEDGLIKADFRNQQGNKITGLTRSVYIYDGNDTDSRLVKSITTSTNDISLHLDPGRYTAVFCWGEGYRDILVINGPEAYLSNKKHLLTLGSLEDYLSTTMNKDYTKVENIQVDFNEVTDLGRIIVPYGVYTTSHAFNNDDTWLTASKSVAGPSSIITLRARFQLSDEFDSTSITLPRLRLDIPNGTTLIEDSIVVETENQVIPDIEIYSSYIEIDLKDETGYLCSNNGTVTYQVRVKRDPEWPVTAAAAIMSYRSKSRTTGLLSDLNEMIGEVYIEIPHISISAPEIVSSPVVNLKGYAPPGANIRIYDGSCLLAETTVSRYGTWMQEVELVDKGDPSNHWLYARLIDEEGNELAYSHTMVTYDSKYPVITMVTMGQDGGHVIRYNLLAGVPTFPFSFVTKALTFLHLEFTNANRVDPDSVVMRTGSGYSQKAIYREDSKDFYVSFYPYAIPGKISIEYAVKPPEWTIPSEIPDEDEVRKSLPGVLMDADVSIDDAGDYGPDSNGVYRSPTVTIRSSETSGVNFELEGWITVKYLSGYTPSPNPGAPPVMALGRQSSGKDLNVYDFHYSITRQGGATVISGGYIAPVEAFDEALMDQMGMQASTGALLEVGFNVIDKLNTFVTGATSILEAPSMFDEIEGLLDYVDQNCNRGAADMYYQLLNIEAEGMMTDLAVTSAMSLVGVGISATGFGSAVGVPVFIAGNLFSWLVSANRKDSVQEIRNMIMNDRNCKDEDEDDHDDDNDNERKPGKRKVTLSDLEYIIDPSGYVYEAVPENRIEGVKTTLYKYNDDEEIWEFWDATYYGQYNPLVTDAEGRYAWDVPEGYWLVMYEKDGYETATSWAMHVPPPHTDVNIGLVSLVSPTVLSVQAAQGGEYIEIVFDKYMTTNTIGNRTLLVQKVGEVDGDDNPVFTDGDILPVNPHPSPGSSDSDHTIARVFRFVPEEPLEVNGEYNLWISGVVQSYAGIIMGTDYTITLTIPEKTIPVTGVTLNRSALTLRSGDSSRLTATVLPANAANKTVTWKSSNPNVANVDNTGLVTAYTTGTAIITVTTVDGGHTASCTVNVISLPEDDDDDDRDKKDYGSSVQYVPVTSITLDKTELFLTVGGEPFTLNATVKPANATNKNILWSSSNQKVVVVSNGTVTPVGTGTAIITARTSDGGYIATCTVTVGSIDVFKGKAGVNPAVLEAFDGDISLVFKTATFLSDTDVTIERYEPDHIPDGYICGSPVFDISFGDKDLLKPVLLITRFNIQAKDGINPLKFALYRWDHDSSVWVYAGGAINTENSTVAAQTETPSRYIIMAYNRTFKDIATHWSRNEVEVLASRHVIDGYPNNEFRPGNQITRAEFVKLVMSMVPYCPYVEAARSKNTRTYNDVNHDKWYFPYVEAASELGIVKGSGGSFRPDSPVTREEMATILIRIFNTPAEMEQAARKNTVWFNDSEDISDWALGAVVLASQKGIIKGDPDGSFRPKDYASRAEAAAVILRTMENLGLIKAPETLKGTLRISEIEGTHFELEVPCSCPSNKTYYVIIPADCIIESQLRLFIDSEVQITGILQDQPDIYMRGPVLKALSIGDTIRTACTKCNQ